MAIRNIVKAVSYTHLDVYKRQVLRDAHQSLLATRMTMDEMRPILPEMDKINYFSVECWAVSYTHLGCRRDLA